MSSTLPLREINVRDTLPPDAQMKIMEDERKHELLKADQAHRRGIETGAMLLIAVALIATFWAMVNTQLDDSTRKFAQTSFQSILGFLLGLFIGRSTAPRSP